MIRMPCSIAANEHRDLQADDILKEPNAFLSLENDFSASRRTGLFAIGRFAGGCMRAIPGHFSVG
jgi:hypothetical protein